MRIEEARRIEVDEARKQAAVGLVGTGVEGEVYRAEGIRERMGRKGEAGDYAERAATPTLERPEEVGVARIVDDAGDAVRGDDLCLNQAGGGRAIGLGEAPEAVAENQARDAHCRAAAALDVAPSAASHRLIAWSHMQPAPTETAGMGAALEPAGVKPSWT